MDDCRSLQIFLVLFLHAERGPQIGSLRVWAEDGTWWQAEWDIGSIDRDPALSDRWFCQEHYERKFAGVLQTTADEANSSRFEVPGATSRWGFARGMSHEEAVGLANRVLALWEEILVDWGRRRTEPV
jgi:hypothetical protein